MSLMTHATTSMTSRVKYVARLMVGSIPGDNKDSTMTAKTTHDPQWRHGKSHTTHVTTTDNTWWPKWRPKYDPDYPDNKGWLPWKINITTHRWTKKFLNNIGPLDLQYLSSKSKVPSLDGPMRTRRRMTKIHNHQRVYRKSQQKWIFVNTLVITDACKQGLAKPQPNTS